MQIKLIKSNTSTGRVELYDSANKLLGTVPATSPMVVGNNTVDFVGVGDLVFSVGYNKDFTTTQIDTNPVQPAPNTFELFLTLLQTSFFNATNAGGSGGGTVGGATAAKQDQQTVKLTSIDDSNGFIQVYTGLTRSYTQETRDSTQQLVGISDSQRVAIGDKTDAAVTNPANDASAIALLKGIVANTAPAVTGSNHYRNSQTTNSVLVKSGTGKILGGAATNRTTGTKYFRFYNINTTPASTLTPVFEIAVLTGQTVQIPAIGGFVLGIAYIISNSANQAGAQLTTADAASLQLSYI